MKHKNLIIASLAALALTACASNISATNTNFVDSVMMDFPHSMPSPALIKPFVEKIAFGSCVEVVSDTKMFDTISNARPDIFFMIGDNVYGDTTPNDPQMSGMRAAYWQLAQNKAFSHLIGTVPTFATWDDHDFGNNDAGGDYSYKFLSERMFETFWNIDSNDERRKHDGIYTAFTHGEEGKKVQFIVLDTRFFRDPLVPTDAPAKGKERYIPHNASDNASILGAEQWAWLEEKLKEPAQIRIIISSIQLVATNQGWEKWGNMPNERQKFFDLIKSTNANGVVVLSGDRHHAAIEKYSGNPYPIYDFTASPFSGDASDGRGESSPEHLYSSNPDEVNFGEIDIDWLGRKLSLVSKGVQGQVLHTQNIGFDEIGVK